MVWALQDPAVIVERDDVQIPTCTGHDVVAFDSRLSGFDGRLVVLRLSSAEAQAGAGAVATAKTFTVSVLVAFLLCGAQSCDHLPSLSRVEPRRSACGRPHSTTQGGRNEGAPWRQLRIMRRAARRPWQGPEAPGPGLAARAGPRGSPRAPGGQTGASHDLV